jgi:hypothetical protein
MLIGVDLRESAADYVFQGPREPTPMRLWETSHVTGHWSAERPVFSDSFCKTGKCKSPKPLPSVAALPGVCELGANSEPRPEEAVYVISETGLALVAARMPSAMPAPMGRRPVRGASMRRTGVRRGVAFGHALRLPGLLLAAIGLAAIERLAAIKLLPAWSRVALRRPDTAG